jgi:nitrile hydratase
MNGVHDMGGMHGFGPVRPEKDEPVFHARWEARVWALRRLMGGWRRWNIDAGRHSIERQVPADYLRWSYYERWLASLITLIGESGLATPQELASGKPDPGTRKAAPPITAAHLKEMNLKGRPSQRPSNAAPRFAVGDAVRARDLNPAGHTRLPRYVRGRVGTIALLHGAHVFPDTNAHFRGEHPHALYTVRFAAHDLWGEAAVNPDDEVCVDLWDAYLEPA